ncbi:MAG: hypothetical protein JSU77_04760 [Fidelibacterota bacterium]|nr:MAG: hypothetical protein JSU77_04760 [Candidatus Neomarinimicrobiota bacterium]
MKVSISFYSLTFSVLLIGASLSGQGVPPPTNLVSIPTGGTLQRGQYELEILMQTGGGILSRLGVGFSDRFSMGMSYGIQHFIGNEKPSLNRFIPEVQLKYRFMDESYNRPAISLGLDTQGRGIFQEINLDTATTIERYEIKAIGIYLVASKNWQIMGNLGIHGGVSKNTIEADQTDNDINLFFGLDKDIIPGLSTFLEYNFALDDNDYDIDEINLYTLSEITVGKGKGYLNAGIRWNMSSSLSLEVDINDILVNKVGKVEWYNFSRELKVVYNEFF